MFSHVVDVQQRVLTVSRKSERLVNLTIALLATKRYLTKSEIFRTVEGYEGAPEAMERMFERDKDDLRSLGIAIELGTFDPLFEDEAGYRITPSSYQLDLGELDGTDIALLSLAASAWSGAALERESTSALIKLSSMGIESDSEALSLLTPLVSVTSENFALITDAIIRRSEIQFEYVSTDLSTQVRRIAPYSMRGQSGSWYLVGLDREKDSLRTFRLDRIISEVTINKKGSAFNIPDQLPYESADEAREIAILRIRKNRGHQLRSLSTLLKAGEEWDEISLPIVDTSWLMRTILWHRDDVIAMEPATLRKSVIDSLKELRVLHG
jgi:proteasome accessory factor B